jgi:hypothetical protein
LHDASDDAHDALHDDCAVVHADASHDGAASTPASSAT